MFGDNFLSSKLEGIVRSLGSSTLKAKDVQDMDDKCLDIWCFHRCVAGYGTTAQGRKSLPEAQGSRGEG